MAPQNHYEEHRRQTSAKIVAIARSVLSGENGIIAGARQLSGLRFEVGAEHDPDFLFFVGVDSDTDHLPIGDERKTWNPEALRAKDAAIACCEARYREKAFEACRNLIRKFDSHAGPGQESI